MKPSPRLFKIGQPTSRPLTWGDGVVLVGLAVLLYAGLRVAHGTPAVIKGPAISLAPSVLPWYAGLSVGRMLAAYALSLLFTLVYFLAHWPLSCWIHQPGFDLSRQLFANSLCTSPSLPASRLFALMISV